MSKQYSDVHDKRKDVIVPKGSGYKVVCPSCRQSYHSTTVLYSSKKKAHGAMFQLLLEYGPDGANWSSFPEIKDIDMGELCCPGCGAGYVEGSEGKVTSVVKAIIEKKRPMYECLICGKSFKSNAGLNGHMRYCKGGK